MNLKPFALATVGVLCWYASRPRPPMVEPPVPAPVVPTPDKPRRRPLLPRTPLVPPDDGRVIGAAGKEHVNGPESDGVSIRCDLPVSEHLKNKGGSDRAGLCVFTSLDMAARWDRTPEAIGFRDYMTKFPGGGYPDKVSQYMAKLSKERGHELVEGRDWGQFTDADAGKLDAILNGYRIACITYGYSPRYGQTIAHMVCLVHADKDWFVILDNNFPGTYEWVPRAEGIRRWKMNHGGWGVWFAAPPPPPVPTNR